MQCNNVAKMTKRTTVRRSFEEIAEHRARRCKLNKAKRQTRTEWN